MYATPESPSKPVLRIFQLRNNVLRQIGVAVCVTDEDVERFWRRVVLFREKEGADDALIVKPNLKSLVAVDDD